jgi:chemotaxis protein MotB
VAQAFAGPPEVSDVRRRLEEALQFELEAGQIQLVDDRRGLVVEVPEAGAFDVGSERLSGYAELVMRRVAGAVADLPNALRVEGHTDDTPIRTARFGSNWELSTARATRVVEFFIRSGNLAADRLSAAGYSQYRPRAANDTAVGRARNRRVDIVILNAATERAEEPLMAGGPQ